MSESRTAAVTVRTESAQPWHLAMLHTAGASLSRVGTWAVDTAQEFGSLVSVLMGPAVLSGYAFASWSLAANLGWTATFPYASGPLSNWLIWLGIAILVHVAAVVLRRRTQPEK